jgi:hypothetical protein
MNNRQNLQAQNSKGSAGIRRYRKCFGRAGIITVLVIAITVFLYVTQRNPENEFFYHLDVIFQELFFIPIVLASFWFELKGGLFVSFIVSMLLIPYIVLQW